jgi:predicted ester cyclase
MKIENFETGASIDPNLETIYLSPKENIKNKNHVRVLVKEIAESSKNKLKKNLENAYHPNAELKGFYPINEIKGLDQIQEKLWGPLIHSFPDLERRDNLILGGNFQNKIFVSMTGHLTGTFTNPWFDVPASNKTIHLRICEVHELKENKIIQSHVLIDLMDFVRQAGFWPINSSLGVEEMWPGPIIGNGSSFENLDDKLSLSSLEQSLTMQRSLNIKPETEPGATDEMIREKLFNHPQKDYWHPKMMWYGPCGIGTARGLMGFINHHQLPFRKTFKERDYWKLGHYVELGDGPYSMTAGWHTIEAIHGTKDWLGYESTGKPVTMRVMDFYLHNEGLIRENWVPIDIIHILKQIDIDVLNLIKERK